MTLIIGGIGQGKLAYVLQKTGYTPEDVAYHPTDAQSRPIFAGVECWVDLDVDLLLAKNPHAILLCCEVGCGVVPVKPEERVWREQVGRLCCQLAEKADRVERIFCGLPMVLKGEGSWN